MCRRVSALSLFLWLGACGSAPASGSEAVAEPPSSPEPAGEPPPQDRPCPMLPCLDGAEITSTFGPANAPLGRHTFDITFGARTMTCTVDFARIDASKSGTCTGAAELSFGPVTRYVEDTTSMPGMVGISFVPVPGRFTFTLKLSGTESNVHVVHRAERRVLLDREASLTYAAHHPNGVGCDPVCQRAEVTWDVTPAP